MAFKVENWPEYEAGLRRRGSLTLWVEDGALDHWQTFGAGGQARCHVRFQGVRTQNSIRFFLSRLNFSDAGMHGGGRALSDG
jgi:hypothetical protein